MVNKNQFPQTLTLMLMLMLKPGLMEQKCFINQFDNKITIWLTRTTSFLQLDFPIRTNAWNS